MDDSLTFRKKFLDRLGSPLQLATLFEYLPGVCFYVKDAHSRLVTANRSLLELRGLTHESQIVGRSDFELHPRYLADRYVSEDQQVMASGKPLPDQVWLIPAEAGNLNWFLSSKLPLFDRKGAVIGVAGMMRDLQKFGAIYRPMAEMDGVLRFVLEHYMDRISVAELAEQSFLSISQFDRRFKALFQMTPRSYILRVRLNAARHLLITTESSITEIALRCGFYDQSSFTKLFRRSTGQTPAAYRSHYLQDGQRKQTSHSE
ncbi:helix-turn-helix domain-containing protein [Planctomicrobium sp. SH661]|uniref:helix-turn-helix domain-containing protein n=1 Tax=Planctomicrobium sp. SH661 TaxID=3448124 RepID=UPI003F5B1DBA